MQYFPANFHFLNNDKAFNRDFFTIYTIDHGLSFDNNRSALWLGNFCLPLDTIFENLCSHNAGINKASY